VEVDRKAWRLIVNGRLKVKLSVIRCLNYSGFQPRWFIGNRSSDCDLVVSARLNAKNSRILDYFVFPATEQPAKRLVSPENSNALEIYRFKTLDRLEEVCAAHGG